MLNEQEYAQIISERFEHLRNKKVLIYGTGIR